MKKVLIITYYWPPSGGAGVQRWLKFVKYLREFGWEPVVYTPANPEAPAIDNSLLKDVPENLTVLKTRIWEPYSLYKSFIGQRKEEKIKAGFLTEKKKPGLAEKISVWIRGNLFIPDARKFWIQPSVKFLSEYLKKNPVHVIVSTGPPHSMHLIALDLKQKLNLPWLADFRDPWTDIDFYDKLMLAKSSDKKHRELEMEVLEKADSVVTIGWHIADQFRKIVNRKIEIITNGFDEDDFLQKEIVLDTKFSISHIGAINPDRNPKMLWVALEELIAEIKELQNDLKINLIGQVDYSVLTDLENCKLTKYVTKTEYLPHSQIPSQLSSAQVLLLALNKTPNTLGVISGKLFEYIAARRPILAIGSENGDAAKILKETNAGRIIDFEDKNRIKDCLKDYYMQYKSGTFKYNSIGIEKYSRKNLTEQLSLLLDFIAK